MKFKNFFFAAMTATALMFTSCGEDDPCEDVDCGVNGTCVLGDCDCNTGYEGNNCETQSSSRYVGTFNVTGTFTCDGLSGSGNTTETITFTQGTTAANRLNVTYNTNGSTATGTATVSGTTITLDSYSFGTVTLQGNGNINGNDISLTRTSTDSFDNEMCTYTSTGTRQ